MPILRRVTHTSPSIRSSPPAPAVRAPMRPAAPPPPPPRIAAPPPPPPPPPRPAPSSAAPKPVHTLVKRPGYVAPAANIASYAKTYARADVPVPKPQPRPIASAAPKPAVRATRALKGAKGSIEAAKVYAIQHAAEMPKKAVRGLKGAKGSIAAAKAFQEKNKQYKSMGLPALLQKAKDDAALKQKIAAGTYFGAKKKGGPPGLPKKTGTGIITSGITVPGLSAGTKKPGKLGKPVKPGGPTGGGASGGGASGGGPSGGGGGGGGGQDEQDFAEPSPPPDWSDASDSSDDGGDSGGGGGGGYYDASDDSGAYDDSAEAYDAQDLYETAEDETPDDEVQDEDSAYEEDVSDGDVANSSDLPSDSDDSGEAYESEDSGEAYESDDSGATYEGERSSQRAPIAFPLVSSRREGEHIKTVALAISPQGCSLVNCATRAPSNFGAELVPYVAAQQKQALMRSAHIEKQRMMAGELVERARQGDQNAMAIIALVRDNAKLGQPRAKASAQFLQEYIAAHPVADIGHEASAGTDFDWAIPALAEGIELDADRMNRVASVFGGEDGRVFLHGAIHGDKHIKPGMLHHRQKRVHQLGKALGHARRLQNVRKPNSKLSRFSPNVGWELGE